jgi:hypothetical protein
MHIKKRNRDTADEGLPSRTIQCNSMIYKLVFTVNIIYRQSGFNSAPKVQMSFDRLTFWRHSRPEGGMDWFVYHLFSFVK